MVLCQRTLQKSVCTTGIGLHSGETIQLTLAPAPANAGICFRRIDLESARDIPARAANVCDTTLCTTLASGDQRVATVEHLLAALSGLGIDNARVDVSAAEVPIMDGSAAPFVELIRQAGICLQPQAKQFLRIMREVTVADGDKRVVFRPYHGFKVSFTIDFEQPVFRGLADHVCVDLSCSAFAGEVSQARTFGFMGQVEYLRTQGFAKGGSFDNAVLVDDYRVLNKEGLRSNDEFVRHKALDAIGDLYLLGHNLIGEFSAVKSGHTLNHRALTVLLDNTDAWELVSFEDARAAPVTFDVAPWQE
ncbi:MAG: UDP-3-O-[3-hydroxymyristoyl] N-acetylglucosamine deacetylase [Bacteroidia bacterium]|jgi:UDP-3-O-[3-hydroxymyristoyl] N-acetylglucosamine deacetylase